MKFLTLDFKKIIVLVVLGGGADGMEDEVVERMMAERNAAAESYERVISRQTIIAAKNAPIIKEMKDEYTQKVTLLTAELGFCYCLELLSRKSNKEQERIVAKAGKQLEEWYKQEKKRLRLRAWNREDPFSIGGNRLSDCYRMQLIGLKQADEWLNYIYEIWLQFDE